MDGNVRRCSPPARNLEYIQPEGFSMTATTAPSLFQPDRTDARTLPPPPGGSERSQLGEIRFSSDPAATQIGQKRLHSENTFEARKRSRGSRKAPDATEQAGTTSGMGVSESLDRDSQPNTTQAVPEQQSGRLAPGQDQNSYNTESTVELVLNPLPSMQGQFAGCDCGSDRNVAEGLARMPPPPQTSPSIHQKNGGKDRHSNRSGTTTIEQLADEDSASAARDTTNTIAQGSHSTEPTLAPVEDPASSAWGTSSTFGGHQQGHQTQGAAQNMYWPIFPSPRSVAEASISQDAETCLAKVK
ncbi:uncharacterized protein BDV17DRAFT_292236 [Aspergillus undulatus]|uniref:uncharacterized protein n=1 Tax=Aspergillus undulatus TaxID=1810928 RepID=UPI003CCCAA00